MSGIIFLIIAVVFAVIVVMKFLHQKHVTNNTVICFTGGLGSGKTYNAVRFAYKFYKRQRTSYNFRFLSFLGFGSKNPPVVYSNIPILLQKKSFFGLLGKEVYSKPLTRDHILMHKRIEENSVVLIDEIGQFASQHDWNNPFVQVELQEFIRFFRHYINGKLILTDQCSANICNQIRRRINIIYNLENFRRLFFFFPFFTCEVRELLSVEDNVSNVNEMSRNLKKEYFIGFLPYNFPLLRWLSFRKYDSRCYSIMYMSKKSNVPPKEWRTDLKTNYLIDIPTVKEVTKK